MNDYIKIDKLWQDGELIELKVVCSTEIITATTKIYVSEALIDDLIYSIKQFLDGQVIESSWANEKRGNDSTACGSLHFMELDDGGNYSSHNCCFFLNTEIGLLTMFCERLPQLKQKSSGIKIILNDDV